MADTAKCACCGAVTPIDLLDGKPPSLAGKPATWDDINAAADRGENFTVLECKKCYGPAWMPG